MKGIGGWRQLGAVVTGLMLVAAVRAEAPNIKPGLWEMKMENVSGGARMPSGADMEKAMKQMQAQMANMPPEQRKMIEERMGAMGVGVGGNGGFRVCLAAEDIRRNDIPLSDEHCKTTIKSQTAKRWAADVSCTQPATTGQVEALFESDTAYLVKMKGQRSEAGKSQAYAMDMRWKYVGADCGKLKPATPRQPMPEARPR